MEKYLNFRPCWKQDAQYLLGAVVGIALVLDGESFSAQPVASDRQVSISAKHMPLKDGLEELCRVANVSLDLDSDGIGRFGITIDTPVTVDLKDVPLETAVRQVFVSLRRPGVYFELDHGKLLVSSIPVIQERFAQKLPENGLAHLQQLADLRTLSLRQAKLNDAHLEHLKGLRELRVLRLGGNRLTDAGLAHLTGMTHLEALEIPNTGWVDSRMTIWKSASIWPAR